MKRSVEAQDGQKIETRPTPQVGGKNGWGGRRHGLESGGGIAPKVSIVLTSKELEIVDALRKKLVNEGRRNSSLRPKNRQLSFSTVMRLAVMALAEKYGLDTSQFGQRQAEENERLAREMGTADVDNVGGAGQTTDDCDDDSGPVDLG